MRKRRAISVSVLGLAIFFFFARVVYMRIGTVQCYAAPAYASLSYAAFGTLGALYTPTAGWLDFPPFAFHDVACS